MPDTILQELERLEGLTRFSDETLSTKAKTKPISQSLDMMLDQLQEARKSAESGEATTSTYQTLGQRLDSQKRDVDDRLKEIHGSLTKFGKAIDKKFPNPLPVFPPLFNSPESLAALERTIGTHFIRTGQFDVAAVFYQEATIDQPPKAKAQMLDMHRRAALLREGNIEPALEWAIANREFLRFRSSPLEFVLHRSRFMKLLLCPAPGVDARMSAIQYGRIYFPALHEKHMLDIGRLCASVLYIPAEKMVRSSYADLASPTIHEGLEPMFAKEYCASLGMSHHLPLRVAADIGGNGALARIEKGKKVMRDSKNEWSQMDELPIEIPVPPQHRYHSIFACPVSKEQSTDKNPPMMMNCGHVVAKESLSRLTKGSNRVKCPYCPMESTGAALQVHF